MVIISGVPIFRIFTVVFKFVSPYLQDEFPEANVSSLLKRLYPYETMLGKEGQSAVQDALSVSSDTYMSLLQ